MKGCVWKRFSVNGEDCRIYVPKDYYWIAKDSDGCVFVYSKKPGKSSYVGGGYGWGVGVLHGYCHVVFTPDLDELDWDKSLRKLR